MHIKRNKFNELIVQNVMNGTYPGYHKSIMSNKCWSLYKGNKRMYGEHDLNDPRVTLVLHRPHSSTQILLECDYVEVAEYITNHEMNFDEYVKQDERLAKYLTSDEGAWGRQDSF